MLSATFLLLAVVSGGSSLSELNTELGISERIIGGKPVSVEDNPWFGALVPSSVRPNQPLPVLCGSSLVSKKHLLTAAHCYHSLRTAGGAWKTRLKAAFGLSNRCQNKYSKLVSIRNVVIHPNYSNFLVSNDIAVVTLAEDVTFQPIALPRLSRNAYGTNKARVVGYGTTVDGGQTEPCTLLGANVVTMSRQDCMKTPLKNEVRRLVGVFCAGVPDGSKDTCQGDSGGPLITSRNGRDVLDGITSFGIGCGKRNTPGVYTNVAFYRAWIDQQINKKEPGRTSNKRVRPRHLSIIDMVKTLVGTRPTNASMTTPLEHMDFIGVQLVIFLVSLMEFSYPTGNSAC